VDVEIIVTCLIKILLRGRVEEPCTENDILNPIQSCRQSSVVECTDNFVIGTISSTSGTNPNVSAEEAIPEILMYLFQAV
jgi:hypothetical protein